MSERTCADCVLNPYPDQVALLAALQADSASHEDVEHILRLTNGLKILGALALERPQRCRALGKLLPPRPHKGSHMTPDARCPEVALLGEMTPDAAINI